jgi:hypothetical protein
MYSKRVFLDDISTIFFVHKKCKKLVQNVFFEKCPSPNSNRRVHQKKKIVPTCKKKSDTDSFFSFSRAKITHIIMFPINHVMLRILSDVYIKKKS